MAQREVFVHLLNQNRKRSTEGMELGVRGAGCRDRGPEEGDVIPCATPSPLLVKYNMVRMIEGEGWHWG